MNEYTQQYKTDIKRQWRELDWRSKFTAIIMLSLLTAGGFLTGVFILSLSLTIAFSLYLISFLARPKPTRT